MTPARSTRPAACRRSPAPSGFYSRYCEPDRERVRGGRRRRSRAPRRRSRSRRAWARWPSVILGAVLAGRPHRRPAPHLLGHAAVPAGPCARFGIDVTFVDGTEPGAFAAAVRPGRTMLVIAETPANPQLALIDLDELGAIRGPITVVDSTFATPIVPAARSRHGVDLGAALRHQGDRRPQRRHARRRRRRARSCSTPSGRYAVLHGACASPFDATQRPARASARCRCGFARQSDTALRWPSSSSRTLRWRRCNYPGLASHPQHDLAKRQMDAIGGSLLASSWPAGSRPAGASSSGCELARIASSLGGPETLVTQPGELDPRRPHPRGAGGRQASDPAWSGCRSGSSTPTTSSPTSIAPCESSLRRCRDQLLQHGHGLRRCRDTEQAHRIAAQHEHGSPWLRSLCLAQHAVRHVRRDRRPRPRTISLTSFPLTMARASRQ